MDDYMRTARKILGLIFIIAGGLVAFFGAVSNAGCVQSQDTPAMTARAEARRDSLELAYAVRFAMDACADVVASTKDQELRAKCIAILDPLVDVVETSASAIDAWTDSAAGEVACAASDVLDGIERVRVLLGEFGQRFPAQLEDAVMWLRALAPSCTHPEAGSAFKSIDAGAMPADGSAG